MEAESSRKILSHFDHCDNRKHSLFQDAFCLFFSFFLERTVSLNESEIVCVCVCVYVHFLVARKNNLSSDVTGVSLPPLPRHLPTAACRSPRWSPS